MGCKGEPVFTKNRCYKLFRVELQAQLRRDRQGCQPEGGGRLVVECALGHPYPKPKRQGNHSLSGNREKRRWIHTEVGAFVRKQVEVRPSSRLPSGGWGLASHRKARSPSCWTTATCRKLLAGWTLALHILLGPLVW